MSDKNHDDKGMDSYAVLDQRSLGEVTVCQKCKSKSLYKSWLTDLIHCNNCHHFWQTGI